MSDQSITLLKSDLWIDGSAHLVRVPRWIPPEDSEGYWHIPRSGSIDAVNFDDFGRFSTWCGVARRTYVSRLTNKAPSANRCGTCEGRAAGYENRDGTVFRPRDHFTLPALCPAYTYGADVCEFCGGEPRYRRNYCHYDERQHRAGEGLARFAPCHRHGWRRIAARKIEGRLVLACQVYGCDSVLVAAGGAS